MFCYRREEELLPMVLARAKAAIPGVRIHLFDDSKDPLLPPTVAKLKELVDCSYEQTTFDRKRNLNGMECVLGELECMRKSMEEDGNEDGYLIKMDPDTLILRFCLVEEAVRNGAKWISHRSCNGHFAGMFYMMHKTILDNVIDNAKVLKFREGCPEDDTIGVLCYLAASGKRYSWTDNSTVEGARKFAAFPCDKYGTSEYWKNVLYCAFAGHILTVGNTGLFGMAKSFQVVNCRDVLWAFYYPDEAMRMCGNPDSVKNLPEIHLAMSNMKVMDTSGYLPDCKLIAGKISSPEGKASPKIEIKELPK